MRTKAPPTPDARGRLRQRLARQPYLLVNCGAARATLAAEREMLEALGNQNYFILHAQRAFDSFAARSKTGDQYSLTDVAAVAGVDYFTAHYWLRENIIKASVRPASGAGTGRGPLFSWTDAFCVGVIGSLRRQGLNLEISRAVSDLFAEKKRTGQRVAARGRS